MSIRLSGSAREDFERVDAWVRSDVAEAIVIETSGSTGVPKQVELSQSAVVASARASLERLGGPGQWLLALPTTTVAGLQVLVRSALADIEPVFAAEHPDVRAAMTALTGERTYASFVPTQLFRLLDEGCGAQVAAFDAILVGGAATPAPLVERAQAAGVRLVRTYGMSETCGGCVYDGVPLDGVQVRIVEGVIEIAGPILFDGYTGVARTGDWFTTSDLGDFDATGSLRVLGRSDDVAISGGINVPLGAVERVLSDVLTVKEVAVVGLPDAEWGQRITAVVVGSLGLDEARRAVDAAGLPHAWAPKEIRLADDLPRLPGGKVNKRALADSLT